MVYSEEPHTCGRAEDSVGVCGEERPAAQWGLQDTLPCFPFHIDVAHRAHPSRTAVIRRRTTTRFVHSPLAFCRGPLGVPPARGPGRRAGAGGREMGDAIECG